jgi:hypothetical protein
MKVGSVMTDADFNNLEEISRFYGEKVLDYMVKTKLIESYEMMPRYWDYDAKIFRKGQMGAVEIKKIDKNVDDYPTVLMEYKKYEAMRTHKADGYYYMTIYNDAVASVYRCDNIETDPQITSKILLCPRRYKNKPIEIEEKLCYRVPTNINKLKYEN